MEKGKASRSRGILLLIDAVVNLVLGVLLIAFPRSLVVWLGIPNPQSAFYPSILGGVLFGIGIALLVERSRGQGGLGLYGAVAINLSGGFVLIGWLLGDDLGLPLHGALFLWGLATLLVVLSLIELRAEVSQRDRPA